MTTFLIYMDEMRSLNTLKQLCLLDEIPGQDLIVFADVVFSDSCRQSEAQKTLKETADDISNMIDMEGAYREDFSVMVYVPVQESATYRQYSNEAPEICAYEMFSILQIQYELMSAFWKRGKYPEHLHLVFGEFGTVQDYLIDVFEERREEFDREVERILWGENEFGESIRETEFKKICDKTISVSPWTFLKGLHFQELCLKYLKANPELNAGRKGVDIPATQLKAEALRAFLSLHLEIGKLTPGREAELDEHEATIFVERLHLEKSNDYHEKVRNEATVFFYAFSEAWKKKNAVPIQGEEANPQTLIERATLLPPGVILEKNINALIGQKDLILRKNLEAIQPDRAVKLPDMKFEQKIAIDDAMRWNGGKVINAETLDRRERLSAKDRILVFMKNTLLLGSARSVKNHADVLCDDLEDKNRTMAQKIKEYEGRMEGIFREVKYRELQGIDQSIKETTGKATENAIQPELSFLSIVKGRTKTNIETRQSALLGQALRQIHWPEDLGELISDARKKTDAMYERLKWKRRFGIVLAPAVFLLLFLLPYYCLEEAHFHLAFSFLLFCITGGIAFFAYLAACQAFILRYKIGIQREMNALQTEWDRSMGDLSAAASTYEKNLFVNMPCLFAEYQYSRIIEEIEQEAEQQKSKITYHRRKIESQRRALRGFAESLDSEIALYQEPERGEEFLSGKSRIHLNTSIVSDHNRPIYGIIPEEAGAMIGLKDAQQKEGGN